MIKPRFWFLTALAVLAGVSHAVPHPPNFSPMMAVALFGAATFPGRWSAFLVPVVSLLLGDLILQTTYLAGWQQHWGFYRGQWVVYACLLPAILLGFAIRERRSVANVAAATLSCSVMFFLVTNFAVWANGSGLTYPKTASGLVLCYEAAIPFFKNALAGDALYALSLFGTLAIAEARFPALRSSKKPTTPELSTAMS